MPRKPKRSALLDAALQLFRDWGKQGGKVGGKLRWKNVSAEARREHARKAAQARWAKKKS